MFIKKKKFLRKTFCPKNFGLTVSWKEQTMNALAL